MAAKVKPFLQALLSPNQTGFLKQRNILHGFLYAQQLLQMATKQRVQIAALKADIFKAFDTLDWKFLLNILQARGFPQQWIHQVQNCILKGSSRIMVNSVAGKAITLKRGVRQGDPVSPYLFNLAMDFLSVWMQKLTDAGFLTPPFPQCKACLLYADDTLILLKPHITQVLKAKLILDIFGLISGLKVNLNKSELALNSPQPSQALSLAQVIHCKPALFPIKYLGLPLSDKNLVKADYMPLIERMQRKLAGWKASLLSIGGRLILTNAVLAATPHYFMSVFLLPAWVTHKIDQIRKRFLWHGHREQQRQLRSLYMVNWNLALKPKDQGGLGVRDITIANKALMMKWMWNWHDSSQTWWKQPSQMSNGNERPWNNPHSSRFWKSLGTISAEFNCSIKHQIGNGQDTAFWQDNWSGTPLKYVYPNLYEESENKNETVSQCIATNGSFPRLLLSPLAQSERQHMALHLQMPTLTQDPDYVMWLRSSKPFSVSSAYHFLSHAPSPTSNLRNIWSIKAPLRVMVFIWLMLNNRLTTTDNLTKRGWQLPSMCVLCKKSEETAMHIFQQCIFTKELRNYIRSTVPNLTDFSPKFNTGLAFEVLMDPLETQTARQWELVTCFVIWRERCRRIFSERMDSQMSLVREIRTEFKFWFG